MQKYRILSFLSAFIVAFVSSPYLADGASVDWRNIYWQYLMNSTEDTLFSIYDADGDGIPELYEYSGTRGVSILSLEYGAMGTPGRLESADRYYKMPLTDEIVAYQEFEGFYKYTVYYKSDQTQQFATKICFAKYDANGEVQYSMNGENISQAQYQNAVEQYDTKLLNMQFSLLRIRSHGEKYISSIYRRFHMKSISISLD